MPAYPTIRSSMETELVDRRRTLCYFSKRFLGTTWSVARFRVFDDIEGNMAWGWVYKAIPPGAWFAVSLLDYRSTF